MKTKNQITDQEIYKMIDEHIHWRYDVLSDLDHSYLCSGNSNSDTIEKELKSYLKENNVNTNDWNINVRCYNLHLFHRYEFSVSVMPYTTELLDKNYWQIIKPQ